MTKLLLYFIYYISLIVPFVKCQIDKQLLWVEPIENLKLDIAKRSNVFFEKREISPNVKYRPTAHTLKHDDSFRLSLEAYNKTVYLHLIPNLDLFHPEAVFHFNGKSVKINPEDYQVYHGYAVDEMYTDHWWLNGLLEEDMDNQPGILGSARVIVRNDINHNLNYPLFEGTFNMYGDIHHIKLKENYHLTKRTDDVQATSSNAHMIIYRDSDMITRQSESGNCGFDRLSNTQIKYNPFEVVDNHMKFAAAIQTNNKLSLLTKRAPTGCPTTKKVLYMGVAADCTYVKFYQSADNARMQIINDWNSVSSVYGNTFNVNIGLINITLMDTTCPSTPVSSVNWNQACSTRYSISSRLSDFSKWRGSIGDDGAGLWHLMTNCATGAEVGIAWMSQVCNTGSIQSSTTGEYTSGTGVSSIIRDEWKVVAHEIGHGFGAIHDCTSLSCPCSGSSCNCCPYSSTQCDAQGKYFMNPTSNASSDAFSPCSISTICKSMPEFMSCLLEPGSKNITTLKQCGNGIKEEGEDCDTGGEPSNCCDPSTCKFKAGAVCDDFNDLCCNNCQLRPANYTCRPASTECDIAEVCSGTSGDCPPDKYKDDMTSCGNGLQCASGLCTSRDAQCIARGSTYDITKACGADNGCQVTCQDPRSALACIQFPGYFVDGTPCGIGGVCKSGQCNTDNFGNNVKNWINSHMQIVIPVAIVVGLLLLFCLFRCCFYPNRHGYNNMATTKAVVIPVQQTPYSQYNSAQPPYYPPPPPVVGTPGNGNNQRYYTPPPPTGWVDPALYNGNSYGPQQPLPAYTQTSDQLHNTYELNNANQWQNNTNHGTEVTGSPSIPTSAPPPSYHNTSAPTPPTSHNNNNNGQRTYNEVIL
ncbi:Metallo-peptidase family M12B Reprolysin-like-domain-containing protein [Cokeromyces recurvatus]|uniref:Metallo-peptidase family M12B Reprolysin-like-domain-containing protein n=1 Tax=Cokeromyces recurvatus TaxID=90255 RepID=UPI00221F4DC0|nr:Metallo-peptidase family M12B Reprolysin-like-domain-containing protein [Cokeromyces recurvatus]KAI7899377.1 Metallo-peptidase family M12B Reprolysin-like-domain-containing protein [Cokeromyces recurvatus]